MRTNGCCALLLGLTAFVVFTSLALSRPDEDDDDRKLKLAIEAAKEDVLKYTDDLDKKTISQRDLTAAAADLAKRHTMEATMKLFKPQSKGGIGIGNLAKAGHKDSIELLIRDYSIRPPSKDEVTRYQAELVKLAQTSLVIAELTPHWAPTKKDYAGRTPQQWKAMAEEMKKGSADLVAAAKANNEKAVETAAKFLNNSCAECHKLIHDDR